MAQLKKCRRCKQTLTVDVFVDTSGKANPRGQFCQSCHAERVAEWHQAGIEEENSNIRKLKIVYGEHWRHYAAPEYFYTTLRGERDFCLYCGTKFDEVKPGLFNENSVHLDHMDPLEKGGEHSIRNVVYCCGPCNIKKGKVRFAQWLESIDSKFREAVRAVYTEKHGHSPDDFIEGINMGRGSNDIELCVYQTEEYLKKNFPTPKVEGPPSNQPLVIKLDIMKAIEALPEELKTKLKN